MIALRAVKRRSTCTAVLYLRYGVLRLSLEGLSTYSSVVNTSRLWLVNLTTPLYGRK